MDVRRVCEKKEYTERDELVCYSLQLATCTATECRQEYSARVALRAVTGNGLSVE